MDAYDRLVLAGRPLLYLPLGERAIADGARDLSGYGRHAAYTSASGWSFGNPGPSGRTAPAFSGNDRIPGTAEAALNPTNVTVEVWAFQVSLGAIVALWTNWHASTSSLRAWRLTTSSATDSANFALGNTGGTDFRAATGGLVVVNRWFHAVGTFDGTNIILYLDGVEVARNTQSASGTQTTGLATNVNIGSYQGGDRWLVGRASRAALYDRALSPAEIVEHYRVGRALRGPRHALVG